MKDKVVAILETRLGNQLAELLSRRGAKPLLAPALAEVPDVDNAAIARVIGDLEAKPAKAVIFQTGVGTQALFKTTDALGLSAKLLDLLQRTTVVARGPKPTAVLRSRAVRIDLSAAEPFTSAEVLEALRGVAIAGERVLVQRYGAPNVELERALQARGAEVIEIPTYRWALPENTGPLEALMDALARREVDATVFTSASQALNLFALAEKLGRRGLLAADLNRTLVASIGPVSSSTLKRFGIVVAFEARPPKLGPLVAALDEALSR